jgi:hypothetical protein
VGAAVLVLVLLAVVVVAVIVVVVTTTAARPAVVPVVVRGHGLVDLPGQQRRAGRARGEQEAHHKQDDRGRQDGEPATTGWAVVDLVVAFSKLQVQRSRVCSHASIHRTAPLPLSVHL